MLFHTQDFCAISHGPGSLLPRPISPSQEYLEDSHSFAETISEVSNYSSSEDGEAGAFPSVRSVRRSLHSLDLVDPAAGADAKANADHSLCWASDEPKYNKISIEYATDYCSDEQREVCRQVRMWFVFASSLTSSCPNKRRPSRNSFTPLCPLFRTPHRHGRKHKFSGAHTIYACTQARTWTCINDHP